MKRLPKLCIHKPTRQYYIRIDRHPIYLGKTGGVVEQEAAEAARLRVLGEYRLTGKVGRAKADVLAVGEIAAAYLHHASLHYRHKDGTPTSEQGCIRMAIRPLCRLYGDTPAGEFGPVALRTVREAMLDARWQNEREKAHAGAKPGWCRKLVNRNVRRIVRMFAWAVSMEMMPPAVHQALLTVDPLEAGRSAARETSDVPPAPPASVAAVLTCWSVRTRRPLLTRRQADIVQLILLTGARPGEACSMRPADLDRTGEALSGLIGEDVVVGRSWAYLPALKANASGGLEQEKHKTLHHGHRRVVPVGPEAQAIIVPYLDGREPDAPIFSPAEDREELSASRRAARKTKVQPSQLCRKRPTPKKQPGRVYTPASLSHALARACRLACVPHFHPHQLRHSAATRLQRLYGWEVARLVCGHSSFDATRIYVARDYAKAFQAIGEAG